MTQQIDAQGPGQGGIVDAPPANRRKSRTRAARKLAVAFAVLAIIVGTQVYFFYAGLLPRFARANEQYANLVDERRDWMLTTEVTGAMNDLMQSSGDEKWQSGLEEVQREFQAFLSAPAEGLDAALNRLALLGESAAAAGGDITRLEEVLVRLKEWHHDYYGDIAADAVSPAFYYWPASMLIKWINGRVLLDEVQFNRALYHIAVGEVSVGQATLGELRTRLPDTPLRARVLYTQGRMLYGMGRYEQSVEAVQESVKVDPTVSLAKRFLEYQLSHGPDEEVEEEDEGAMPFGSASTGGGTLF